MGKNAAPQLDSFHKMETKHHTMGEWRIKNVDEEGDK
jgi:hypothetical protein